MSNFSPKSLSIGNSPAPRSITLPTGPNLLIGGWERDAFIGKCVSVRERRPSFVVGGIITLQGD